MHGKATLGPLLEDCNLLGATELVMCLQNVHDDFLIVD